MRTLTAIVAAAGLAAGLVPLGAAAPASAAAAGALSITATPTAYGCDITVRAHNKSTTNVTIDLEDSEVKVRNGLWSKLNQGGNWIDNTGGEHESKVVTLDLGCNFDRQ
ncbi:MAG: hypothetical protein AB7R55_09140, partial [Gemmatimonadales bacterium]